MEDYFLSSILRLRRQMSPVRETYPNQTLEYPKKEIKYSYYYLVKPPTMPPSADNSIQSVKEATPDKHSKPRFSGLQAEADKIDKDIAKYASAKIDKNRSELIGEISNMRNKLDRLEDRLSSIPNV